MSSFVYRAGALASSSLGTLTRPQGPATGTVDDILGDADPMQALIDAMGLSTKPDYMFGGNEASGATEIGGSGFDLVNTGCTQQQTSAALGGTLNTILHDGNADNMRNTASAGLQPGAASYGVVAVYAPASFGATYTVVGDMDGITG